MNEQEQVSVEEQVVEKPRIHTVTSLSAAAYCAMRGLKPKSVRNTRRKGQKGPEFEFVLDDPEGIGPALSEEYWYSDFRKFDDECKALRGMLSAGRKKQRG